MLWTGRIMMAKPNYKQVFAKKARLEKELRTRFPKIDSRPAIYIYHKRTEENELRMYIGQSVNLLDRTISHMEGYSHIDISLRKWGWYDEQTNPYGWKFHFYYCPKNELDKLERAEIQKWTEKGATLYNITDGGQGEGKSDINARKPTKTYKDGLAQGELNLKRKLNDIISKYLTIGLKKEGKLAENALNKFWMLLNIEE